MYKLEPNGEKKLLIRCQKVALENEKGKKTAAIKVHQGM